jgi:integrase
MSTTQHVNVERALNNLQESQLNSTNVEAIRSFIDHCAAEGMSEIRQDRLVSALKNLIIKVAPPGFELPGASEQELKRLIAALHRSDYKQSSQHTIKSGVKKFYRVEDGGHEEPEKTKFFSVDKPDSSVSREDIFTKDELKQLFRGFSKTRDRAFTMMLYESAARPGEMLSRNIGDFTTNAKGDFIYLEGLKDTPDRTNQLIRAGRTVREWLAQHPLGGDLGDIQDPSAPLWVKSRQQQCKHCDELPRHHDDDRCVYEPDLGERMKYFGYLRRFKDACERAEIAENKRRPYNLRHTRLTEVATFMGYEQLNKFAGWVPGSSRAKIYVHLNSEDVNKAIREQYGLDGGSDEPKKQPCPFCDTVNQPKESECRRCGRPLSLRQQVKQEEKLSTVERLVELEEKGVLDKLDQLEQLASGSPSSK